MKVFVKWLLFALLFPATIASNFEGVLFSLFPLSVFILMLYFFFLSQPENQSEEEDENENEKESSKKTSTATSSTEPGKKPVQNVEEKPLNIPQKENNQDDINAPIELRRVGEERSLLEAVSKNEAVRAQLLIEGGISPDTSNSKGVTALMFAVKGNHEEMAGILIRMGADLNRESDTGLTPLSIARQNGNIQIESLLLKKGAIDE